MTVVANTQLIVENEHVELARDFRVTRNLEHFVSKICDLGNIGRCYAQGWENKTNICFFSMQDNLVWIILQAFIYPKSDAVDSTVCDKEGRIRVLKKRVTDSDFSFSPNNTNNTSHYKMNTL